MSAVETKRPAVDPDPELDLLKKAGDAFANLERECRAKIEEKLKHDSRLSSSRLRDLQGELVYDCNDKINSTLGQLLGKSQPFFFSPGYQISFAHRLFSISGIDRKTEPWRYYHRTHGVGSMCAGSQPEMDAFFPLTCFMTELYEQSLDGFRFSGFGSWFSSFFDSHYGEISKKTLLGIEITLSQSGSPPLETCEPAEVTSEAALIKIAASAKEPLGFLDAVDKALSEKTASYFKTAASSTSDRVLSYPIIKPEAGNEHRKILRESFAWLLWSIFRRIEAGEISQIENLREACAARGMADLAGALAKIIQSFQPACFAKPSITFEHYYVLVTQPGISLMRKHGAFQAKSSVATINLYTANPLPRTFLLQLRRSVTAIYELLQDIEIAVLTSEQGQQTGFLDSAHDYSKDIGSACLKMSDFNKSLERSARAILEQSMRLADLPAPAPEIGAAINKELNRLHAPRMEWFATVQFTHAHLRTQTFGPIQDEPAECVAMIEAGTLRSIYNLVRSLVWLPLHYAGYKELEQSFQAASPGEIENPLTWAALFRYDMKPTKATSPFHEKLGRRIFEIIREQNMSGTDFLKRFPAPEINPGSRDFDAPLLWGQGDKERWEDYKPIERLLPLMVFSLRFAFQCAWARTLLGDFPAKREPIRLSASRPVDRTRRIEITFAAPDSGQHERLENIPYYLEWRQQMSHYSGRTYPWKDVETDSVTLNPVTKAITISLSASV